MIYRLHYVGFAVHNVDQTRRVFRDLFGLASKAMPPNQALGVQCAACIPFPNECWLYVMQSCEPNSSVHRYITEKGPGLERLGLLSDDLQLDYERICAAGVPLHRDDIQHVGNGRQLTVPGAYACGITVDVMQLDDDGAAPAAKSDWRGIVSLQHIGVAVPSLDEAAARFQALFDLEMHDVRSDQHGGEQKDGMIEPGNELLWLHVTESWGPNARVREFMNAKGSGLEHLCIEVADIRDAVTRVTGRRVPIYDDRIFTNRDDGFEAFVYPEHTTGVTIELIEPYPTSRGYRQKH